MSKLSKSSQEDWAFFLHPETGRRTYNSVCLSCVNDCKQSFRVEVLVCPRYRPKQSAYKEG